MSAVGHYLEQEGIATVQISLIREHTEALRAPRALWVPFMLGRPFGSPSDPEFQSRVLKSALRLIERTDGPILEDFPDDAPIENIGLHDESLACPVSFPSFDPKGSLDQRLLNEVSQLGAWHDLAITVRKRTTLGLTGASPAELATFIGSWLGDKPQETLKDPSMPASKSLKLATDELKSFYFEAKAMQPGHHTHQSIQNWFWFETSAGEAFMALRNRLEHIGDPSFNALATLVLVPREVQEKINKQLI